MRTTHMQREAEPTGPDRDITECWPVATPLATSVALEQIALNLVRIFVVPAPTGCSR